MSISNNWKKKHKTTTQLESSLKRNSFKPEKVLIYISYSYHISGSLIYTVEVWSTKAFSECSDQDLFLFFLSLLKLLQLFQHALLLADVQCIFIDRWMLCGITKSMRHWGFPQNTKLLVCYWNSFEVPFLSHCQHHSALLMTNAWS